MFEITWHKIWCIMNESQNRKIIICGNNFLGQELYDKLSLLDIPVEAVITEDNFHLNNVNRIQLDNLIRDEHYVIFVEMENDQFLVDKMKKLGFEMFYHYRFLKDFYLPDVYVDYYPPKRSVLLSDSQYIKDIPVECTFGMFVLSHKKCNVPQGGFYRGLQLGSLDKEELFELKDKDGENISKSNMQFCELTGIYWLWKNMNIDYIGICHYRRYFYDDAGNILDETIIRNLLNQYDMLVPIPMRFKSKNKRYLPDELDILTQYQQEHYIQDLLNVEKYLKINTPEYCGSFWNILSKKMCYGYNMFVSSKKLFDSYCEWLFPILFDLERNRKMLWEDAYQKRVYGFLAERLFNVWIHYNQLKCKEMQIKLKEL